MTNESELHAAEYTDEDVTELLRGFVGTLRNIFPDERVLTALQNIQAETIQELNDERPKGANHD